MLSELVETSAGHEIYLRRPEHLGLTIHQPAAFETVSIQLMRPCHCTF